MPTTILDNETYPEALQRRYAEETKAEKQAEIIRMAREVKLPHWYHNGEPVNVELLERFADLVAEHEREACAKVCDEFEMRFGRDGDDLEQYGANQCAAAIRARGK